MRLPNSKSEHGKNNGNNERWQAEAKRHYARLSLPAKPAQLLTPLLTPLLARVRASIDAAAQAARSGVLRVDDELSWTNAIPTDLSEEAKILSFTTALKASKRSGQSLTARRAKSVGGRRESVAVGAARRTRRCAAPGIRGRGTSLAASPG